MMTTESTFKYDVFISHSETDKEVARKLALKLNIDGLKVCVDEQDLEASWKLILLLSRAAVEGDWARLERHTLIFKEPANTQRNIIPILLDNCPIPTGIAQFSTIDWRDQSNKSYAKILGVCRSAKKWADGIVVKEAMVLKGHRGGVVDVAITPDGKRIVSGSDDNTLKVWNLDLGQCIATFEGHKGGIFCFAITNDGKKIVSGSEDKTLKLWDLESGKCLRTLKGHSEWVGGVVITPDNKKIVSGSADYNLKVWALESGKCIATLKGHEGKIYTLAVPMRADGRKIVSGSRDQTLKVWDLESRQCIATFVGHTSMVYNVSRIPDGKRVVSGSYDQTLKVWDLESGQCLSTFEGHTGGVYRIAATPDGKRVVSASLDNTLKVWDLESGQCLATLEGHTDLALGVAVTPDGKQVVSGSRDNTVRVWEMPEFEDATVPGLSARYTNAKVVLVGESGVGKTGLALRLTENDWKETGSTHGMEVRRLELPGVNATGIDREVWLWDFAGQPDYRLIHQLYMDETALALMVIDPQRDNPFDSLGHWEKALEAAVKHDPARLLVAGRCDRGGITISTDKLKQCCKTRDYSAFINTAAKTGKGCEALKEMIADSIPWDRLPWTATSLLFKTLKDAIIGIKEKGMVLGRISELRQRLQMEISEGIGDADLRAVVGLLAGQGIVQPLDFGDFVLLQPEQINNYASAVVRCVRENTDEIGCIPERDVLDARFDFKDMTRLTEGDEKILLRAMVQTLIDRALCLREDTPKGPQLIFPSYFRLDRPEITEHPNVFVTYGFTGMPEEVYTTLVVRLHYTHDFDKAQLWKDAADFKSLTGKRVGLQMTKQKNDAAEIKVYFEADVPMDAQVSFIKYIHEHLLRRAKEVTRVRSYVCPHCDTPLENRKAIKKRLEMGKKDILCGVCEKRVTLIDMIEKKFASDEFQQKVRDMEAEAQINIDNESRELILVGHAFSTAGEAGQIFRPVANSDWGLDGEIEFKNNKGEACGERLYLQLKSGDSYLYTKKDGEQIFAVKNKRHAEYWQSHKYPVMLVIRTSDGKIRWMNVTDYLKEHGKKTKHIVFDGEPFTALNVARMRDKALEKK